MSSMMNVVLTVTDHCSNISTCNSVITLLDTIPPTAMCESQIGLILDENGMASITTADVNAGSTDNCSSKLDFQISQENFTCSDLENCCNRSISVVLSVTDACGLSSSCISTIILQDTMPPIALCVEQIGLILDDNGMASITAADVDAGSSDNCSSDLDIQLSQDTFTCADLENNCVRTFAIFLGVTDECGNCLLYTSPSPRDATLSRMPSSA